MCLFLFSKVISFENLSIVVRRVAAADKKKKQQMYTDRNNVAFALTYTMKEVGVSIKEKQGGA